jgi:hypothetical protein
MLSRIRQRATYANVTASLALIFAVSASPVGAEAAGVVKRALRANNADKVDGLSASRTPKPGQLLALDGTGRFPSSVFGNAPAGPPGPAGPAGPAGAAGPAGKDGAPGATGAKGADGKDGAVGPTGPKGADGTNGAAGPTGPKGADGTNGAVGPTGPRGADGKDGTVGPTGPKGADGKDGAAGPTGPKGAPGISGYEIVVATNFASQTARAYADVQAYCPSGKRLLGGGARTYGAASTVLVTSAPLYAYADQPRWWAEARGPGNGVVDVEAWAICGHVTQ